MLLSVYIRKRQRSKKKMNYFRFHSNYKGTLTENSKHLKLLATLPFWWEISSVSSQDWSWIRVSLFCSFLTELDAQWCLVFASSPQTLYFRPGVKSKFSTLLLKTSYEMKVTWLGQKLSTYYQKRLSLHTKDFMKIYLELKSNFWPIYVAFI